MGVVNITMCISLSFVVVVRCWRIALMKIVMKMVYI